MLQTTAISGGRHTPTLSQYCEGRDNNFNLLRIIAASLVIVTHAYGITGNAMFEPFKVSFGISLGSWAVDIFFVVSGLLVTKSWDRNKSFVKFVWARFMRIYPGLWICVLLSVFLVGCIFTTIPTLAFLLHPETITFLAKNLTLVKGTYTSLPGTFLGQGDGETNASLWTLPYEIRMYFLLLVLGWSCLLYKRGVALLIVLIALAIYVYCIASGRSETRLMEYSRFVYLFFLGCYFYLEREGIPLKSEIVAALLVILFACQFLLEVRYRTIILSIATPYLILYFAFVPAGFLRAYNRLGDYSYGLYIYASPTQQVIFSLGGSALSLVANISLTIGVAMLFAAISWHMVESKAVRVPVPQFLVGTKKKTN